MSDGGVCVHTFARSKPRRRADFAEIVSAQTPFGS
jgi:hypothetical protein